ncbi:hypothetical protein BJX63DRAFT_415312 [Aspergillus granulosus]|uniref:Chitinase n=1 Tax=Aspergillus granulosus TaxID=176169 RepID=A0ABR4GUZ0_9EURO
MSYDLHGAWDGHSDWVEPELNSHTNLTEITNALDLLWRNNIEPDEVVLGIAFYARVFAASNPSCMEPGCLSLAGTPGFAATRWGSCSIPRLLRPWRSSRSSPHLTRMPQSKSSSLTRTSG